MTAKYLPHNKSSLAPQAAGTVFPSWQQQQHMPARSAVLERDTRRSLTVSRRAAHRQGSASKALFRHNTVWNRTASFCRSRITQLLPFLCTTHKKHLSCTRDTVRVHHHTPIPAQHFILLLRFRPTVHAQTFIYFVPLNCDQSGGHVRVLPRSSVQCVRHVSEGSRGC
ncbi:hypothetical protein TRVL_08562 [Trypanosoma vivax]|nr:hypothetical protein TRVL_08562 [Trypanosoma vivax]